MSTACNLEYTPIFGKLPLLKENRIECAFHVTVYYMASKFQFDPSHIQAPR